MRIVLKDQAILAGSRPALVPVAQNVFGLGRLFGHKRPFQPGIESRSSPPAQAGAFYFIDDGVRLHPERLLYGLVTVQFEIAIDIGRPQTEALGDDLYLVGM